MFERLLRRGQRQLSAKRGTADALHAVVSTEASEITFIRAGG